MEAHTMEMLEYDRLKNKDPFDTTDAKVVEL
jgi:hypothetical protein